MVVARTKLIVRWMAAAFQRFIISTSVQLSCVMKNILPQDFPVKIVTRLLSQDHASTEIEIFGAKTAAHVSAAMLW